ncbi:hypothetical protein TNCT_441391 [Trichonephila clavata]|uniref:Uncharacterized protein n=1 Tax=Trichonephila clavata TaxID=2740835 RepID=A0A8X6J4D9_TRICU|nr:hypothetical protein TNCT_441391 [Trichonephila clavata]
MPLLVTPLDKRVDMQDKTLKMRLKRDSGVLTRESLSCLTWIPRIEQLKSFGRQKWGVGHRTTCITLSQLEVLVHIGEINDR